MTYQAAPRDRAGKGRAILVADDDPIQRKLVRIYLEQLGFQVTLAEDGEDAFQKARSSPPDAILSDMLMPRLDGFRLCLKVRRDPLLARIPVVLTSAAFVEEADRKLAQSVGASGFILRTPDMSGVIDCLLECLDGSARPNEPIAHLPAEEYAERISEQLGRQAAVSADLSRRLEWVEAKLAVLAGFAESLRRTGGTDLLVDEILHRALEASGAPRGAAYVRDSEARLVLRTTLGLPEDADGSADFFGHSRALVRAMELQYAVQIPGSGSAGAGELPQAWDDSSFSVVPLVSGDEALGVLALAWDGPERTEDWPFVVHTIASQASQAVALSRALSGLQESERRLAQLKTITDAGLAHLTLDDLLPELLDRVRKALRSDTAAILLIEGDELVPRAAKGLEEEVRRGIRIPLGEGFAGRIVVDRRPLVAEDLSTAQLVSPVLREEGISSLLGVPLLVDGQVIGVIHVGMLCPRHFAEADTQLLQLIGDSVASLFDRSRLYTQEREARARAEAAQQRLTFLSRASVALAETLDYEATLNAMAGLAVPEFADWCRVDILAEDGSVRLVAEAPSAAQENKDARQTEAEYPPLSGELSGIATTLSSGKATLFAELHDSAVGAITQEASSLELVGRAGMRSVMMVPLISRGRVVAAVTFAGNGSRRRYDEDDLAMAEEFARRCALGLDNARLYEEAKKAVKSREDFMSVAAHELKSPITSLRGFAQVTLRRMASQGEVEPERLRRTLEVVDQQSTKLARLINQLLDVSRLDQGKLDLERRPVDLVRLVNETVIEARTRTGRDDIAMHAPSELPALVDPLRIEQVLSNLLDNAVKFSPDGGSVDVDVRKDENGYGRIAIRDHGVGVPEEQRQLIFERLFQDRSGHLGGLGLGLYISRSIVEMHGGRIWVEDPVDGGSRFVVSLPVEATA
ncbi:MAG TPA: GAF domain-containing protein [Chloroflexota bacterium]